MQALIDEYAESHQNSTNKKIHYFAVPIIFWAVTAILWVIKLPEPVYNLSIVVAVLAAIYYLSKDLKIAIQMILFMMLCLLLNQWIESQGWPLLYLAIGLFIFAWILQFYGHKIEGKKPSFFKDLQFLMIGPAWIVSNLFAKK